MSKGDKTSSEPTPNRVLVYLRVRPPNREEEKWLEEGKHRNILVEEQATPNPTKNIIVAKSNKPYEFDKVFRDKSTQMQMFQEAALPTLEHVFSGYCGAVLAYGQTGTGKTHTMQGITDSADNMGIIPRTAKYLFRRIASESRNFRFGVKISFVQIYLDKLQDLFQPDAPEVNINHDLERVELPGISEKECYSDDEFMSLFRYGEKHRITRATKMNATSSRGHAALIVNIHMTSVSDPSQHKVGKLVLVDLAGYERYEATGITSGIAAQEAKKINASLLALGSVVNALADASKGNAQTHVPYRNSKLTRLLKDCLGGTSCSAIILTMGPCDRYVQETTTTLFFGWRAMAVKVDAKIKALSDPTAVNDSLRTKIAEACERIKSMATWWSKSHPNDYKNYCAKFGVPDTAGEIEDFEIPISATIGQSRLSPTTALPPREDDHSAPGVARVRADFQVEVNDFQKRNHQAESALIGQQQADLEKMKKEGASPAQVASLREQHRMELKLFQEQQREEYEGILDEQQAEEVSAMLKSAKVNAQRSDPTGRTTELFSFLQATCKSKDDIFQQLCDHIVNIESDAKGDTLNYVAMCQMYQDADQKKTECASEVARLKRRLEDMQSEKTIMEDQLRELLGKNYKPVSVSRTGYSTGQAPHTHTQGYSHHPQAAQAPPPQQPYYVTRTAGMPPGQPGQYAPQPTSQSSEGLGLVSRLLPSSKSKEPKEHKEKKEKKSKHEKEHVTRI